MADGVLLDATSFYSQMSTLPSLAYSVHWWIISQSFVFSIMHTLDHTEGSVSSLQYGYFTRFKRYFLQCKDLIQTRSFVTRYRLVAVKKKTRCYLPPLQILPISPNCQFPQSNHERPFVYSFILFIYWDSTGSFESHHVAPNSEHHLPPLPWRLKLCNTKGAHKLLFKSQTNISSYR